MEWFDVPLFPLHAVLFPRQRLTLHVFEKRYRTMMEWCWMQNIPFGIVFIQSGREVGDRPVPHRVGTLARLQDMTLFSDGRMVVNVTGRQRFYIAYSAYDGPCLTARVRPLADVEEPFREIESLVARVRAQFHHYCAARRATKTESWHIPRDPVRLSWVVAAALEMDQVEKQRILSTSRVSERLLYLAVRLEQALHETSGWEEGGQCG